MVAHGSQLLQKGGKGGRISYYHKNIRIFYKLNVYLEFLFLLVNKTLDVYKWSYCWSNHIRKEKNKGIILGR